MRWTARYTSFRRKAPVKDSKALKTGITIGRVLMLMEIYSHLLAEKIEKHQRSEEGGIVPPVNIDCEIGILSIPKEKQEEIVDSIVGKWNVKKVLL